MPNCNIKYCRAFKSKNQPDLTFHKLPRNEKLKKKWLDAIGTENLNLKNKELWVCSQHFEECEFNRTLDVVRLRENTVPSIFKGAKHGQHTLSRTPSPLQSMTKEILYIQSPESLASYDSFENGNEQNLENLEEYELPNITHDNDLTQSYESLVMSDVIESDNEPDFLELDETLPHSQNTSLNKVFSQSYESLAMSDVIESDNEQDFLELDETLPQTHNTSKKKVFTQASESFATSDSIENDNEQDLLEFTKRLSHSQNITQENEFSQKQQNTQTIEVLNQIRMIQRREIKQLNERVRKRRKKIEGLNKIIEELKRINKMNSEQPTVLIVLD